MFTSRIPSFKYIYDSEIKDRIFYVNENFLFFKEEKKKFVDGFDEMDGMSRTKHKHFAVAVRQDLLTSLLTHLSKYCTYDSFEWNSKPSNFSF